MKFSYKQTTQLYRLYNYDCDFTTDFKPVLIAYYDGFEIDRTENEMDVKKYDAFKNEEYHRHWLEYFNSLPLKEKRVVKMIGIRNLRDIKLCIYHKSKVPSIMERMKHTPIDKYDMANILQIMSVEEAEKIYNYLLQ